MNAAVEERVTPETGEEFFNRANPTRRVIRTELILDAELVDEWNAAQEELVKLKIKEAQKPRQANAGGRRKTKAIIDQETVILGIEERIETAKAWFTLRQMPSTAFQALKDQNPPREANELDRLRGYNRDAVSDGSVRGCLVDPALKDCEKDECTHDPDLGDRCNTFQMLQVVLAPTEWEELRESAMMANGAVKDIPKSQQPSSSPQRLARGSASRKSGK